MRRRAALVATLLVWDVFAVAGAAGAAGQDEDRPARIDVWSPPVANALGEAERAAGWRLLWDGRTGAGWRAAGGDDFPDDGWSIEDGVLSLREAGLFELRAGGDLFTRERYADFVLDFEFWVAPGGNSGVKYRAVEQRQLGLVHSLGCEFQILDDARHPDAARGRPGTRRLSGLYDMLPATPAPAHDLVGRWNHGRVHLENGRLSHYLNGVRVVDVRIGGPAWRAALAGSKFADREGYCPPEGGHIVLQDHGNHARFRNLRLLPLDRGLEPVPILPTE